MGRMFLFVAIGLFMNGCGTPASLPDGVQLYFPAPQLLEDGVAQKYYFHWREKSSNKIATNINYLTYRLLSDGSLVTEEYNTDFRPVRFRTFRFEEGQMVLQHHQQSVNEDTVSYEVVQPFFRHFTQDSCFASILTSDNAAIEIQQTVAADTTQLDRAAKYLRGYYRTRGDDAAWSTSTFEEFYAEGLGLCKRYASNEQVEIELTLIEQIKLSDFEQMKAHGKHRVAYIDPDRTLGYRPDFKLCTTTGAIIDYYNPEPDITYRGGKHALRKAIQPQINAELLQSVSGYLTFRFVVNCNGETGRFVFEPASLDFQAVQIPAEAVQHLGAITAGLDDWLPGEYRGEPRDAYVYLTYKFRDGELVELLP